MMASTHTVSTSCSSPTQLDLPFAYSSYNHSEEERNSNKNHDNDSDIDIHHNNDTVKHTMRRDNGSTLTTTNLNLNSLHDYDFDPDYYSTPSPSPKPMKQESNGYNVVSNDISCFTPSYRREIAKEENYSDFVAVTEDAKSLNPTTESISREHSKTKYPKQENKQQERIRHPLDSSATMFMPADTSYRSGMDILSLLLETDSNSLNPVEKQSHLIMDCEMAQIAARDASNALVNGEFEKALQKHTIAAKAYRDLAISVQEYDVSLSNSLLLLSQDQARNGTSLLALHHSNAIQLQPQQSDMDDEEKDEQQNQLQSNSLKSKKKQAMNSANTRSTSANDYHISHSDHTTDPSLSDVNSALSSAKVDQHKLFDSKSSTPSKTNQTQQQNQPTKMLSRQSSMSNEEKIRATIRGALTDNKEADISDSTFLGMAGSISALNTTSKDVQYRNIENDCDTGTPNGNMKRSLVSQNGSKTSNADSNPVDELMKLERELKDMDMALQLGNSVASLSLARANNSRMKHSSMEDGGFCVVHPGSNSMIMGSEIITPSSQQQQQQQQPSLMSLSSSHRRYAGNSHDNFEADIRARASRLHSISNAKTHHATVIPQQQPSLNSSSKCISHNHGDEISLDSSWWGNASTHSASSGIFTSSSIYSNSNGTSYHNIGNTQAHSNYQSNHQQDSFVGTNDTTTITNTKQVMRLLDSLKTLGDENAALLKEVEGAQEARLEVKAVRTQMKSFKAEYGKRFTRLKAALDKVRKENGTGDTGDNPINSSEYMASKVSADIKKKDQMIQKLAVDLRKEREESKKKDIALRKYENFYKEVKLKALQRQKEQEKLMKQKEGKLPQLRKDNRFIH